MYITYSIFYIRVASHNIWHINVQHFHQGDYELDLYWNASPFVFHTRYPTGNCNSFNTLNQKWCIPRWGIWSNNTGDQQNTARHTVALFKYPFNSESLFKRDYKSMNAFSCLNSINNSVAWAVSLSAPLNTWRRTAQDFIARSLSNVTAIRQWQG